MRCTKRAFSFLLSIVIISSSAFAQINIDGIDIDYEKKHVVVSGKTDVLNSPVGVNLLEGVNIAAFGQKKPDENGKFNFSATIDKKFCDKDLTLTLTQVGAEKTDKQLKIYSNEKILAWLNKVNELSDDWKTETALYYENVLENMIYDAEYYQKNTDELLDMVSGFKKTYTTPKEFALDIERAIVLDKINKTDLAGVKTIINDKYTRELLSIDIEIADSAFTIFEEIKQDNSVSEILKKNGTGIHSPSDCVSSLCEANFIAQINLAKAEDIKNILVKYRKQLREISENADNVIEKCTPNIARKVAGEGLTKISTILNLLEIAIKQQNLVENEIYDKGNNKGIFGGSGSYVGSTQKPQPLIEPEVFDSSKVFEDMTGYEWANEAVSQLARMKIINGIGDNRFEPERTVSREEFVKMAVLLLDLYDGTAECSFTDVSTYGWYYPYIASAAKAGLVLGTNENTFGLGKSISREDIVTILYRAIKDKIIEVQDKKMNFGDIQDIDKYAYDAVESFYTFGIVSGFDDGNFAPLRSATRAESACIIYNVYKFLGADVQKDWRVDAN